jgi:chromosome segregation ATPase
VITNRKDAQAAFTPSRPLPEMTCAEANEAHAALLLAHADIDDLRALVPVLRQHVANLKEQVQLVTIAANLNAETVRDQQTEIRKLEAELTNLRQMVYMGAGHG